MTDPQAKRAGERTRTVTWHAPEALRRRRLAMGGLDFFRTLAEADGPQVPLYDLMGFRLAGLGEGWSRFTCTPGEHLCNPLGTIHGGLPAAMIDSATGVSVQSTLEEGLIPATIRLHVDFVRAIPPNGVSLICEGRIAKPGRQIALADATLADADGKLYARGQATFAVSKRKASASEVRDDAADPPDGQRTIAWSDPARTAGAAREAATGLDFLQRLARGEVPPPSIAETLDFDLVEVGDGRASFACTPQPMHYNPMGTVHGGLAATLIDSATGCAVQTKLDKGLSFTTVYLSTEYFRGLTEAVGEVRASAQVVRHGSRLSVADAALTGSDGTVYARGTATCIIYPF